MNLSGRSRARGADTLAVTAALALAACGQVTGNTTVDPEPLAASTTVSLVPVRDVVTTNVWGGGGAPPDLYRLVADGTSYAASDDYHTVVRSAPGAANAVHTTGFAGAPAGAVSRVVVHCQAEALRGASGVLPTGTIRARLYDGDTLLGSGPAHALGAAFANFDDTFDGLSVADGNQLRVEIDMDNASASTDGTLRYTLVWIDLTIAQGTGLRGDYFDNQDFTAQRLSRTDATVDFDWGTGAPDPSMGVDTFSVRWTGQIQPRYSETYTFTTTSDDGMRLWIDGTLVVSNWTDHGATANSGTIALTADRRHDVRLEYYEDGGDASARLAWRSASQASEIVPTSALYPPTSAPGDAGTDAGTDATAPHDGGTDAGAPVALACPSGFAHEVFRDDFDGSALDTTRWQIQQGHAGSGGDFTQLTNMRAENIQVSGGVLRVASERHCEDPYTTRSAPVHPAACAGTNYYSGAWIKATGAFAASRGSMAFLAQMPTQVPGIFPGLWGRNDQGGSLYGELDLIEMWWDTLSHGVASDPGIFATTTIFDGTAYHKTTNNAEGPFAALSTAFHVWEAEWDATVSPATVTYYYRDTPGAARTLLRTVTSASTGLSGIVTESTFAGALNEPWRPYIDFAVQPATVWHVGPDSASVYDPTDLLVDSVIVCQP